MLAEVKRTRSNFDVCFWPLLDLRWSRSGLLDSDIRLLGDL